MAVDAECAGDAAHRVVHEAGVPPAGGHHAGRGGAVRHREPAEVRGHAGRVQDHGVRRGRAAPAGLGTIITSSLPDVSICKM